MIQVLLTILLAMPAYSRDAETHAERVERMTNLATSIAITSARATCSDDYAIYGCRRIWPGSRRELIAAVLTQGKSETNFARHVQANECGTRGPRFECDARRQRDGSVAYLARSYFQLHETRLLHGPAWDAIVGLEPDAIDEATWAATRALSASRAYCSRRSTDWVEGMFANLATGSACVWAGAAERAKTFRRMMARLAAAEAGFRASS